MVHEILANKENIDYMSAEKIDVKIQKDSYLCEACPYVYDPEKGDPDGGILPGTPFEDIPDDWLCYVPSAGLIRQTSSK